MGEVEPPEGKREHRKEQPVIKWIASTWPCTGSRPPGPLPAHPSWRCSRRRLWCRPRCSRRGKWSPPPRSTRCSRSWSERPSPARHSW